MSLTCRFVRRPFQLYPLEEKKNREREKRGIKERRRRKGRGR
jgi:hypothetical protein